jgi:hypothetical protein
LFETAARGCFSQGKPSIQYDANGSSVCLYRSPNGLKCAIGHCIPDELYGPSMEGKGLQSLLQLFPRIHTALGISTVNYSEKERALSFLQSIHDCAKNWKSEQTLRSAFQAFGKQHALSTDFLSDLHFPKEPQQ